MTEELLHLLDRHSLVYCVCCKRPPEFVRVNALGEQSSSQLPQAQFDSANAQTLAPSIQTYEEGRIIISSGGEIVLQMQFCSRVEVDRTLLISLSKNQTFSFV